MTTKKTKKTASKITEITIENPRGISIPDYIEAVYGSYTHPQKQFLLDNPHILAQELTRWKKNSLIDLDTGEMFKIPKEYVHLKKFENDKSVLKFDVVEKMTSVNIAHVSQKDILAVRELANNEFSMVSINTRGFIFKLKKDFGGGKYGTLSEELNFLLMDAAMQGFGSIEFSPDGSFIEGVGRVDPETGDYFEEPSENEIFNY